MLLLLQDQQVVQAFLPYTPPEPLTEGIRAFRMNRRFEQLDATGGLHTSKTGSKLTVVITKQLFRCLPERGRFSQRYARPKQPSESVSRLRGSPCVIFRAMTKKACEGSNEQIGDLQEVTRPHLGCVSAQEGCPPPASWLVGANRPQILLDGALADAQAQFQQFCANPLRTEDGDFPWPSL